MTNSVHHTSDDDRGSLVMAMLLIMVGTMFAGLLVPAVITQVHSSQYDVRRDHSMDAARAGVQFMIGKIRDANNGGSGSTGSLPCTTQTTPLSASVSSGGNERYKSWVYYFARDPHGHDDWLNYNASNTYLVKCTSTSGTGELVPSYAVIVSTGTDDPSGSFATGTRTLQATYAVQLKNPNIPGGLIHNLGSTPDVCLDAGSSSPTPGTIVTLQACDSGSGAQQWAFGTDLTIQLSGSADPANGVPGLCLSAASPHATNNPVTVTNCSGTTDQLWSYTGNRNFQTTKADKAMDGYCMSAQTVNTVGSPLLLGACTFTPASSFLPDTNVGAGNAGAAQKFIVNYNQFGRCLDITNEDLNSTFLISYPCKVSPDTGNAPVNQQWNFPPIPVGSQSATGQITSVKDSSYCLVSPLTLGGYPHMSPCAGVTNTASKTWTVWANTGTYATSYRINDSSTPAAGATTGYCLQPTDPSAPNPDLYGSVPKIIVTTCSSSTLQKWNAPPGTLSSSLTDYHEK